MDDQTNRIPSDYLRRPDHGDRGAGRGPRSVAAHLLGAQDFASRHEAVVRHQLSVKLAALTDSDFAGNYDPAVRYPGPMYFVPSDTLVGLDATKALGICGEHDLFGGVVPYPFAATKVITHPLVKPDASAPGGWSHAFSRRVSDIVHTGFSVFTAEDARRAGLLLLESSAVRLKPARAAGGRGQIVVSTRSELETALGAMDATELSSWGLVIEENLSEVTTYSVGQVRVADLVASYYGTQRLTRDNGGRLVYGGSDLLVVRGEFGALLGLDLPEDARLAVLQGRAYDAAAIDCFTGMFASRRNYDVARGIDAESRWRSGVIEQSWRIGGASGAEIAALEAFRADPLLRSVRASTVEVYGETEPPPRHAAVYFQDADKQVGLITKYALVEPNVDPRSSAPGVARAIAGRHVGPVADNPEHVLTVPEIDTPRGDSPLSAAHSLITAV
jgi:hypothetical protein